MCVFRRQRFSCRPPVVFIITAQSMIREQKKSLSLFLFLYLSGQAVLLIDDIASSCNACFAVCTVLHNTCTTLCGQDTLQNVLHWISYCNFMILKIWLTLKVKTEERAQLSTGKLPLKRKCVKWHHNRKGNDTEHCQNRMASKVALSNICIRICSYVYPRGIIKYNA